VGSGRPRRPCCPWQAGPTRARTAMALTHSALLKYEQEKNQKTPRRVTRGRAATCCVCWPEPKLTWWPGKPKSRPPSAAPWRAKARVPMSGTLLTTNLAGRSRSRPWSRLIPTSPVPWPAGGPSLKASPPPAPQRGKSPRPSTTRRTHKDATRSQNTPIRTNF